jgi:hypothetical protein
VEDVVDPGGWKGGAVEWISWCSVASTPSMRGGGEVERCKQLQGKVRGFQSLFVRDRERREGLYVQPAMDGDRAIEAERRGRVDAVMAMMMGGGRNGFNIPCMGWC